MKTFKKTLQWIFGSGLAIILFMAIIFKIWSVSIDIGHKKIVQNMSKIILPETELIYVAGDNTLGFINADGTNFETIFIQPFYDDTDEITLPSWDKNASNIVFLMGPHRSSVSYPRQVFVWQPSKTHYEICINAPLITTVYSIEISPDGQKVFYSKGRDLFMMNLDTCKETKLITLNNIAFATINWKNNDLVVSKLEDDRLLYIPNNQQGEKKAFYLADGSRPAFSPDGERIVFVRNDGIYLVDIDSSSERLLFSRLYNDFEAENGFTPYPRWSPDGQYIVFHDCEKSRCYTGPDGYGIYTMNIETLEKTYVVSNGVSPYWRWAE